MAVNVELGNSQQIFEIFNVLLGVYAKLKQAGTFRLLGDDLKKFIREMDAEVRNNICESYRAFVASGMDPRDAVKIIIARSERDVLPSLLRFVSQRKA